MIGRKGGREIEEESCAPTVPPTERRRGTDPCMAEACSITIEDHSIYVRKEREMRTNGLSSRGRTNRMREKEPHRGEGDNRVHTTTLSLRIQQLFVHGYHGGGITARGNDVCIIPDSRGKGIALGQVGFQYAILSELVVHFDAVLIGRLDL